MSYRNLKLSLVVTSCALLATLIIAPLYIPEQKYHKIIEHLISEGLDRQVKIAKLKYQLLPLPHVEGTNITIMSSKHEGEAVIGRIGIWLSYTELLKGKLNISRLHFNGVATNQAFIESFITKKSTATSKTTPIVNIKQITATSVSIRKHDNTLIGPFRFKGDFDDNRAFTEIELSLIDQDLKVNITPVDEQRIHLNVAGNNLYFPQYSSVVVKQLNASAFYETGHIDISQFIINAYDAQLNGSLSLKHENKIEWLANANVNINSLQLANINQFIMPANNTTLTGGVLGGSLNIQSRGSDLTKLHTSANIHGQLTISDAYVQSPQSTIKIDSASAVATISKSEARFEKLQAQLYGGLINTGQAEINWGKLWKIKGELTSEHVDFDQLISKLFHTKSALTGKLTSKLKFSSQASAPSELAKNLSIDGDLELEHAAIRLTSKDTTTLLNDFSSISAINFKYAPMQFSSKQLLFTGYSGLTTAKDLRLTWQQHWTLNTKVHSQKIHLEKLLRDLGQKNYISGYLDSEFELKVNSPTLESFMDHIDIAGRIEINQGFAQITAATTTEPTKGFSFDQAQANIFFDKHSLLMTTLDISAYQGVINVKDFHLKKDNTWSLYSDIKAHNIELEPFLRDTLNQHLIAGKAGLQTTLALKGAELNQLTSQINANGAFTVNDGIVYNADIEHAAAITSIGHSKKAATVFSELASNFEIINHTIALSKLRIASANLTGKGDILIDENHNIEGTLDVALRSTGSLLKMPLNVSGTINEPAFALTGGALVGSAVGTSILGPGLGTFVGLQTGKIFTGIGNLFSRDKKQSTR